MYVDSVSIHGVVKQNKKQNFMREALLCTPNNGQTYLPPCLWIDLPHFACTHDSSSKCFNALGEKYHTDMQTSSNVT